MKQRCLYKNHVAYKRYGSAGIFIAEEWLDFRTFLSDMGPRPRGASLDRIDNTKGYCKSNCRWATCLEQATNRSDNVQLAHKGKKMCLSEWSKATGIGVTTLHWRFRKGLSADQILDQNTEQGKAMRSKTHCPSGHPYDDGNTYVSPSGHRKCKTCNRLRAAKLRQLHRPA